MSKEIEESEGNPVRKNIFYNSLHDQDIDEWFESLPRRMHSAKVREAIRFFMENNTQTEDNINTKDLENRIKQLEEPIKEILAHLKENEKKSQENKDVPTENEYVNARDMLKNLGK